MLENENVKWNLLAVIVISPCVNLTRFGDGETVEGPDGHVDDLLAAQTLNHSWFSDVLKQEKVNCIIINKNASVFLQFH